MAQIQLSDDLYSKLESIVSASSEFSSVEEYIAYVMKQVVEKKQKANSTSAQQDSSYSKEDEDKIRERLKNLGYLD